MSVIKLPELSIHFTDKFNLYEQLRGSFYELGDGKPKFILPEVDGYQLTFSALVSPDHSNRELSIKNYEFIDCSEPERVIIEGLSPLTDHFTQTTFDKDVNFTERINRRLDSIFGHFKKASYMCELYNDGYCKIKLDKSPCPPRIYEFDEMPLQSNCEVFVSDSKLSCLSEEIVEICELTKSESITIKVSEKSFTIVGHYPSIKTLTFYVRGMIYSYPLVKQVLDDKLLFPNLETIVLNTNSRCMDYSIFGWYTEEIRDCYRAGITLKIITDDFELTFMEREEDNIMCVGGIGLKFNAFYQDRAIKVLYYINLLKNKLENFGITIHQVWLKTAAVSFDNAIDNEDRRNKLYTSSPFTTLVELATGRNEINKILFENISNSISDYLVLNIEKKSRAKSARH